MGFRYHRSVKLMPGLRLNFSKSGVGLSAGGKGYHVSQMANGRTRRTISIPGTGMSWISQSSQTSRGASSSAKTSLTPRTKVQASSSPAASAGSSPIVNEPGLFASKDDKDLVEAIKTHDVDAMDQIGRREPRLALAAATISGFVHLQHDQDDAAQQRLQWVFDNGEDPAGDPFIDKYVNIDITVAVVDGASAVLPTDRTTVGLLLAELLQRSNDVAGAINVVEQLTPTSLTALSLAELDAMAGRYDDVIQVTEGCQNVDDATSLLCTFRGIAFREQAHYTAARACFADALRSSKRDPAVRHRAWFERAKCYGEEGQRAKARQDLERILAEDSDYEGLHDALAALDGTTPSPSARPLPPLPAPPTFAPTSLDARSPMPAVSPLPPPPTAGRVTLDEPSTQ